MLRPTFDQIKADRPLSLAVDIDGATHYLIIAPTTHGPNPPSPIKARPNSV